MTDDPQARLATALESRYRIERELGAGGMATVYLAHDVRHDRKVALKVLRPELSAILGGERFLTEIKTTANLQHPHILSLFDSGEAGGLVYYVMPFVDGESLRDRMNRERQLPVDEAVRLTKEIADALNYAHQHGIVHRDIKPENILLHGGHAMVADFGIALAASRTQGGTRMTETGMSLGTPQYMAPEQAMGEREITAKADIYALGCVLYEMLAGEPPFVGPSAQAIIARVMTESPRSLTIQRRTIPAHIEAAVERALEKLPADRFASAGEFAQALDHALPGRTDARTHGRTAPSVARAWIPWAIVALLAAAGAWGWLRPKPAGPAPAVLRYAILPTDSMAFQDAVGNAIAMAPDGSGFAYVSRSGIMYQAADKVDASPVSGARRGSDPFFSWDSRYIAYRSGTGIVKVPVGGGSPIAICDSCPGYGFQWAADDTVRFHAAPPENTNSRVLLAVSARGGRPHIISRPDSGSQDLYRSPFLVPGTRTVLFTIWTNVRTPRIGALDLDHGTVTRFDQTGMSPRYVAPGFVIAANPDGELTATPFDARHTRFTGPTVSIVRDAYAGDGAAMKAGVSDDGAIVYIEPGGLSERHIVNVNRNGSGADLVSDNRPFNGPRFSPDGKRVAIGVGTSWTQSDIWVLDIAQRAWARLTTNSISAWPVWTPDGRRIVYGSDADLWWTAADGAGQPQVLLQRTGTRYPAAVTPDGKAVVFVETGSDLNGIRRLAFDSAPAATTILPGSFNESAPDISPDGNWIAYQSDEAGRNEVYVRPWPGPGARVTVSVQGGSEPIWSPRGGELFYRAGDTLVAATVTVRPTFSVTARHQLFVGQYVHGTSLRQYDVAPDGQHFLMIRGGESQSRLIMVRNLFAHPLAAR